MKLRTEYILKRHANNPIITPADLADMDCDAVFNCGQAMYKNKTILLLSVVKRHGDPALHLATSDDGISFTIDRKPFITSMPESTFGALDNWAIDPRITQIGDIYYITRPLSGTLQPACALYRTSDWKTVELVECIALPCNRVPCIFPEKIDGLYYRLDRPYSGDNGEIWLSASPDLIFWGKHRKVSSARLNNVWAVEKIGPTPPIKTDQGWLVIIHGVLTYAGGSRYSLGAIMLDLEEPWRIISKSTRWILTPDAIYEQLGNCHNTVFACGALADAEKDEIRIYYGAADTCIGLATGKLSSLIDECFND